MSRKFYFAVAIIMVLSAAASAVEFRVEFDSRFNSGNLPTNRYFTIKMYMNNGPGGWQINGFNFPFKIAGPQIYWVDAGGRPETGGALEILNGFAPGDYRFTALNTVRIPSVEAWDGILPDSIDQVTATTENGWGINEGELLVYVFHASAGVDAGEICIDSISNDGWGWLSDWIWFPETPFGGPYCAQISSDYDLTSPPWFVSGCPPETLDVDWGTGLIDTILMEVGLDNYTEPDNTLLTGTSASFGDVTITDSVGNDQGGAFIEWAFDAGYDMLGTHDVQIKITDQYSLEYDHAVTENSCNFTLNIKNTPPIVTAYNCGDTVDCCIGTAVQFPFQVTDINPGDYLSYDLVEDAGGRATISGPAGLITFTDDGNDGEAIYEVIAGFSDRAEDTTYCTVYFNVRACCGDANDDGDFNLLDVLFLIDHVYGTPPGPAPDYFAQGDVVIDGNLNLLDILYLIRYLYGVSTGPAPPACQ